MAINISDFRTICRKYIFRLTELDGCVNTKILGLCGYKPKYYGFTRVLQKTSFSYFHHLFRKMLSKENVIKAMCHLVVIINLLLKINEPKMKTDNKSSDKHLVY